jgi:hypothetical protein
MEKPMSKDKIPQTDSIQELAEFWDTHDLTEVEDELEEVTEPLFEHESSLSKNDADTDERLAKAPGIDSADMRRGVDRLLTELHLLKAERVILQKLSAHDRGDFFRLVQLAMRTDHVIRLGRLLDKDHRSVSIWTLFNWHAPAEQALMNRGWSTNDLDTLFKKVVRLRHNIFAHNASSALRDPNAIYRLASLKSSEIDRFATSVAAAIEDVYRNWLHEDPPKLDEYSGADFETIYKLWGERLIKDSSDLRI